MGTCRGWTGDNGDTIIAAASGGPSFFPQNGIGPRGAEGRAPAYYSYSDFGKHIAAPVGFRQLLVSRFVLIIVHSVRGQLTFDPLPLCPLGRLLGRTVGKWQGCVTSKINVHKYGSDASSFMGRLPNSHRGGRKKRRRRRGKALWRRRYCYSNEAGSWARPPWLMDDLGVVHAPPVQNCPVTCKCFSLGKKKKKPDTKGKKTYRMEGIKGVKLPWCVACSHFCKWGTGVGPCRGCWIRRNRCNGEHCCDVGHLCRDPANKGACCYLRMSPLFTSAFKNNLFRPRRRIGVQEGRAQFPC